MQGDWLWNIQGAHPNMKACSDDLVSLANTYRKKDYEVSGVYSGTRTVTFRKGEMKGYMHCLPDTVDPRGPKGK